MAEAPGYGLVSNGIDRENASTAWRACCGSAEEEEAKEREADRLLRQETFLTASIATLPAYSERQLARHRCTHGRLSLDAMQGVAAQGMADPAPPQSALDELAFLCQISPLTRCERACVRAWILGWTQREMALRLRERLGVHGQGQYSRWLRSGLQKCYAARGLTFAQFSRRTLYRRPHPRYGRVGEARARV